MATTSLSLLLSLPSCISNRICPTHKGTVPKSQPNEAQRILTQPVRVHLTCKADTLKIFHFFSASTLSLLPPSRSQGRIFSDMFTGKNSVSCCGQWPTTAHTDIKWDKTKGISTIYLYFFFKKSFVTLDLLDADIWCGKKNDSHHPILARTQFEICSLILIWVVCSENLANFCTGSAISLIMS